MILAVGISWCTASSRFASSVRFRLLTPVTLPPGRLRLATMSALIGSEPVSNTIGIVAVAALAARAAGVAPAMITAT
jgi:hypothetical protein